MKTMKAMKAEKAMNAGRKRMKTMKEMMADISMKTLKANNDFRQVSTGGGLEWLLVPLGTTVLAWYDHSYHQWGYQAKEWKPKTIKEVNAMKNN